MNKIIRSVLKISLCILTFSGHLLCLAMHGSLPPSTLTSPTTGGVLSDVQQMRKAIKEIEDKIDQDFHDLTQSHILPWREVVIALGPTGDGKSTLINFLAGKSLTAFQRYFQMSIDVTNPLPGIVMGHSVTSKTLIPHYWHDTINGVVYYDCPGFGDTRGETVDIRNAFALHKLFKTFNQAKIVFVASEGSLGGRALTFLNALNHLGELFENNLDKLCKSTCLLITRQEKISSVKVVRDFIKDEMITSQPGQPSLPLKTSSFLQKIYHHCEIALFPAPKNIGPFLDLTTTEGQAVHHSIMGTIASTPTMSLATTKLSFSSDASNFALKISQDLYPNIKKNITQKVTQQIQTFCTNVINTSPNIQKTRRKINKLHTALINIDTTSLQNFIRSLDTFPKKYPVRLKKLKKLCELVEFLEQVNDKINPPLKKWKRKIEKIRTHVQELGALPQILTPAAGVLELKGMLISLSDFTVALTASPTPVHLAKVFSLNTLYVDDDIQKHTPYSETPLSLAFFAPQWIILNAPVIDLSGQNGGLGTHGKMHGQPGHPGHAGGNGGHFYGKGDTFVNLAQLTVNTCGGNGGDGGNGVDGQDGINGPNGILSKITKKKEGELIEKNKYTPKPRGFGSGGCVIDKTDYIEFPIINSGFATAILLATAEVFIKGDYCHYSDKGERATPPTNGGQAGQGGIAGYEGQITLDGAVIHYQSSLKGKPGKNGSAGKGGKGGVKDGKDCQGTVITNITEEVCSHGITLWKKSLPDRWLVENKHKARTTAPYPDGISPSQLNSTNIETPTKPHPLNIPSLLSDYKNYYNAITSHLFKRDFPNL